MSVVHDLERMPPFTPVQTRRAMWPGGRELLLVGTGVNVFAYSSLEPAVVAAIFGMVGLALIRWTPLGGVYEMKMYRRVFGIGWLMAGVAAVYANYLNDVAQNVSDPATFYALASGSARDVSLEEMKVLTEGAGAVIVWRWIYDAFAAVGFAKERYVGILINVLSVALAGVVAVKIAKCMFGEDGPRLHRLILLFSACGMFWLFAAIHLRDAVVLLGLTIMVYYWIRYLARPKVVNLAILLLASAVGVAGFAFLRTEFAMVPVAMLMAGVAAGLLFTPARAATKAGMYVVLVLFALGCLVAALEADVFTKLERTRQNYQELSVQASSADSLGNRYITNAPLPLRMVIGSGYLFLFPIPFWTGFGGQSAYHLFKSFNVLFFYALTPLVGLTVFRVIQVKALRTRCVMFLFFVVIGFTMAVAATSLETRHFGGFVPSLMVLALVPDLTLRRDWRHYTTLLSVMLAGMGSIHVAWAMLKMVR